MRDVAQCVRQPLPRRGGLYARELSAELAHHARPAPPPAGSSALVAEEVGYGSETAFSRAFSAQVGMPPRRWREEQKLLESPAVTGESFDAARR